MDYMTAIETDGTQEDIAKRIGLSLLKEDFVLLDRNISFKVTIDNDLGYVAHFSWPDARLNRDVIWTQATHNKSFYTFLVKTQKALVVFDTEHLERNKRQQ